MSAKAIRGRFEKLKKVNRGQKTNQKKKNRIRQIEPNRI